MTPNTPDQKPPTHEEAREIAQFLRAFTHSDYTTRGRILLAYIAAAEQTERERDRYRKALRSIAAPALGGKMQQYTAQQALALTEHKEGM